MAQGTSFPSVLEIHLLGPFRVLVDGQLVDDNGWQRAKPKLLVKLLALQPHHRLHREQVMEVLWPGQELESAGNSLHKAIHLARRALEPELRSAARSHFILTQGRQIVLSAPEKLWVDVEAFEQAAAEALRSSDTQAYERALGFYQGNLLIEDPYEDWILTRREHLRGLRQDLLIKVSRLYEVRGQHQHGMVKLKEVIALDPTNEEAYRHLMLLYALAGNRQQALQQYEQCCENLLRELDARPEESTIKLHEQIVSGEIRSLADGQVQGLSDANRAINSIAILPLTNTGEDPNVEYLADGITESLINSLAQLPSLRVMARSTMFRYKGRDVGPQDVGSDLGVRAVLVGRVQHRRERLLISAELVDMADGSQVWGEQYDRELTDIFAVQDEITRQITEALRLRLSTEETKKLTKHYTENIKAYQLYLRGRHELLSKYTEENWKNAVKYFEEAINEDPVYALAIAGLSYCYLLASNLFLPPKEASAIAEGLARKALEIDDALAEAHASLAVIAFAHHWDWTGAEREIKHALELKPKYADAHWVYGIYLASRGRFDEGLAEMKQAQELDPRSLPINIDVGWVYYLGRRYAEAGEHLQKALEIDPNNPEALVYLGRTYVATGDFSGAIALLQKASGVDETQWILAMLGYAHALSGRRGEGERMIEHLKEMSKEKYVSPLHIALIYSGLEEKDQAISWLEKAYEERADMLVTVGVDPVFDNLRSDPRFQDLVRRIGLAP